MRRTAVRLALAALLAAVAVPSVGQAAAGDARFPDRSPWVLDLEIGWAKLAMDQINEGIGAFNEGYHSTFGDLPEINGGVDFGVGVGRRLSPALTAGLKFTRLDASTDLPDPIGAFEIGVGANVWNVYAHWVPPMDEGMAWGVGADLGVISTTGSIDLIIPPDQGDSGAFDGSAPAAAAYLILDLPGTRVVSIQGQVGYRAAKITDVKVGGQATNTELDYSGFFFRAAFLLHP